MKRQTGRCILCNSQTRRKPSITRPCCNKCEKTAPVAISCPGLFTKGPAALVARAAENAMKDYETCLRDPGAEGQTTEGIGIAACMRLNAKQRDRISELESALSKIRCWLCDTNGQPIRVGLASVEAVCMKIDETLEAERS
jgi:hypothetical protein